MYRKIADLQLSKKNHFFQFWCFNLSDGSQFLADSLIDGDLIAEQEQERI